MRISNELERKREREKREERRENNAIYSGHLRFCLQPRAAHTLRSDQLITFVEHISLDSLKVSEKTHSYSHSVFPLKTLTHVPYLLKVENIFFFNLESVRKETFTLKFFPLKTHTYLCPIFIVKLQS